jgi:transcriptional regulator with XRE-family HTH domain
VERERPEKVIEGVGKKVAEIRRSLGWTQQQAAERLRMPLKNLQRVEAGMNLTLRTLVRIANGFGVRARSLLDEPSSRERRKPGRPRSTEPTR